MRALFSVIDRDILNTNMKQSASNKKIISFLLVSLYAAGVIFLSPHFAFAQEKTIPLPNPLGDIRTPQAFIGFIIQTLFGIIGSVALLIFVYGGMTWMLAQGDQGKIKDGRETMVWAALGLMVVFGSYTIVRYILQALQAAGNASPAS